MHICIAHGGDMGEPSGGTDRVSALARGLFDSGESVTLVIPEPSGELPTRLEPIDVIYAATSDSNSVTRASTVVRSARQVARSREAVLQIEHSSLAGIGTLHGIEGYVLDMHDLAYSRYDHVDALGGSIVKRGVKWLEARAIDRAAHVIVVSEAMAEMLQSLWGVPSEKMTVIPNGYFPESIRTASDVSVVPDRVAFFGTLHPKVDVAALETIARLPVVSDLVIIGDGAQRSRLDRFADGNDTLRTTGRLPDDKAFDLLRSSAVVINPQLVSPIQRSSSPVKLYYYGALGKAMVVTSGPSVVEYLVRQRAAMAAFSGTSFVGRVRAALGDRALRESLETNAQTVAEEFQWSERTATLNQLYRDEFRDRAA